MFLALKEMQREKTRYGLIIAIIALISFLIFMLTALALGLRNSNSAAVRSWDATSIALNSQADSQLSASLLTQAAVTEVQQQDSAAARLGYAMLRVQPEGYDSQNLPFMAIDADSFVAKNIALTAGNMFSSPEEVVVDESFATQYNIAVGDSLTIGDDASYTVVGLAHNALFSVSSVVYGDFSQWAVLREVPAGTAASAMLSQQSLSSTSDVSALTIGDFIDELPGYSAQNATFSAMIGTLGVVTLVVIAVFLYILVLQKLPNIAVLRAQGVPSGFLIRSVVLQAVLMTFIGVAIAAIIVGLLSFVIPASLPTLFSWPLMAAVGLALIVMAVVGALIPARQISRVDPIALIG